ncbi:hypothetical protein EMQ25_15795 [Arsenicitalea aurantiaca]|uniref:Uncharacterized protein n=1 Tax=Arsenicitalea aurantiaca TaxID=1783274 RepID=A0A433X455_9HYPH|nr:hypothetical protein [Arsenicitalea aurantiaca]RUT28850.1 hypothetical protein EMQ25_15795 [Arsenicitalea aurantiaca]
MRILHAFSILALLTTPALAQEATPEGTWRDSYGTTLQLSLCGDGTQLCATLVDVHGDSRTEENLAYVNQQIMQAEMTAPNQWSGTVIFDGSEAASTATLVAADTLEIQGCRAAILCQTLSFTRI